MLAERHQLQQIRQQELEAEETQRLHKLDAEETRRREELEQWLQTEADLQRQLELDAQQAAIELQRQEVVQWKLR